MFQLQLTHALTKSEWYNLT